jgi:hypothetical protein
MKKKINIPKLQNEDSEREYWSKINLDDYFESADFRPEVFPDLKPKIMTAKLEKIIEAAEEDLATDKNLSPQFSDAESAIAWLEEQTG